MIEPPPINERLIISLYDYSGQWAQPYVDAGYPVILWDKKVEGDLWSSDFFDDVLMNYKDFVYGILAAPPCTHFTVSGAGHWKNIPDEVLSDSIFLVELVYVIKDQCPNVRFFALENPVGRLQTLVPDLGKPWYFQPYWYGDLYSKKTGLWGRFNPPIRNCWEDVPFVTASNGDRYSPIHWSTGGKSEKTKTIRSTTPAGFARAFFDANR